MYEEVKEVRESTYEEDLEELADLYEHIELLRVCLRRKARLRGYTVWKFSNDWQSAKVKGMYAALNLHEDS